MPVELADFDFVLRPDLTAVRDRCVVVAFVTPHGEPADRRITRFAVEAGAIDLSLVRAGRCPVLLEHRNALDALVGEVVEVWPDGGTLLALVRLGTSPEAERILGLIRDALPIGISVGALLIDSVPDPDGPPDSVRVTRWALNEISFVTLGADRSARVIKTGADAVEMAERHRQRSLEQRKALAMPMLRAAAWRHWAADTGDRLAGAEPGALSDLLYEETVTHLDKLATEAAREMPVDPVSLAA